MKNEIIYELIKVFTESNHYKDENDELLKSKIQSDALNMNNDLLQILLRNELLRDTFFVDINGTLVFDKVAFSWIVQSSEFLPNSYTSFKNKIGLIDDTNQYISLNDNVSLAFPFKDCILEFDSTTDKEERNEVFFNELLCKNDIDVLFENKIFSNAKIHSPNNIEDALSYTDENLVIKGNNLITMYSLLPRFEGKIKCMYWDILYNTDNDQVPYNDSFKHSSWLLMMKNRLEIAKRLLRKDGVFIVECDKHEDAYLKVLCDEIFGRDKFINSITIQSSTPSGTKLAHRNKTILKTKDTLFIYKMSDNIEINPQYTSSDNLTNFDYWLEEIDGVKKIYRLRDKLIENNIISKKDKIDEIKMSTNKVFEKFIIENAHKIFRKQPSLPDEMKKLSKAEPTKIFEYFDDNGNKYLCQNGVRFAFLSSSVRKINGEDKVSQLLCDIWTDISFHGTQYEGNEDLPAGKKPERLLKRIMNMFMKEGDIILDAYSGSGTTAVVAEKLGLRYIVIEQLENHFNKTVSRLDYVISGLDKGPVSLELNYSGGGTFIACELLKQNELWLDVIKNSNIENIDNIYEELINNPFIVNYKVNIDVLKTPETKEEFIKLSFDDKKKILIALIDVNNLYLNYSNKDDKKLGALEKDIKFSKSFYGE